ncbi:hypothetical protein B7P43_G03397 [Cryptotermes secundus]|uniref:Reverse transcriptase domain-containing protein n=1 Tax=Cryptotermes secundus TaxID=105785 RepID=A0A2J7QH58_9NEOP|nr:hypothetical protein B7P43_G03397 [Cryptotermes secundus]
MSWTGFKITREDLAQFITSVVNAAGILEYHVSESALVCHIVQNMHLSVRPRLTFESEPRSVEVLYALASRVAEARAVIQRMEGAECRVPGGKVSRDERDRCPISTVKGMVCQLDLIDDVPVRSRPYQCSPHSLQALREIVRELLNKGVVKKSFSQYASPAFLVPKSQGGYRMVVHY